MISVRVLVPPHEPFVGRSPLCAAGEGSDSAALAGSLRPGTVSPAETQGLYGEADSLGKDRRRLSGGRGPYSLGPGPRPRDRLDPCPSTAAAPGAALARRELPLGRAQLPQARGRAGPGRAGRSGRNDGTGCELLETGSPVKSAAPRAGPCRAVPCRAVPQMLARGSNGLHLPWRPAGAAQAQRGIGAARLGAGLTAGVMRRRGAVQRKVPCLFVTEVKEQPSAKRERQPFKVLATETITAKAIEADIYSAIPTEKVDGTCCYVTTYKGQPYLWARLDRKPNKRAEKKLKQFLYSLEGCKEFAWNIEEDFKPVPDTWIPAKDIEFSNGNPLPDENGHMPGWVPVEKNSKQYCWHSSVVNYEAEIALVLKHHADPGLLEISPVPLSEILEQTLELIGTNINANPYGLGSKKQPVHLLVPHGAFEIKNPPPLKQNDILSWFEDCNEGKVEGIVWHCNDGCLIKLHRHHLGLRWPLAETYLNSQPVVISFNRAKYDCDFEPNSLFHHFSNLNGQRFDRLQDIKFDA